MSYHPTHGYIPITSAARRGWSCADNKLYESTWSSSNTQTYQQQVDYIRNYTDEYNKKNKEEDDRHRISLASSNVYSTSSSIITPVLSSSSLSNPSFP